MTADMSTDEHAVRFLRPSQTLLRAAQYTGEPGSIAAARDLADTFLQQLTAEWLAVLPARTAQDVRLVVSELVTNADRHSFGPYFLELEGCAKWLSVTVYDSSCATPVRHGRDPGRVGGHGMEIVHAVSDRVTVENVPVGKRVRADFALDPEA
ncbi:ATP-binding protein [Streptomyces sp. SP18CS02]|uniref:ATP-binding protein n=1 Tax=Streptomyces sp. SP18CS02 TaxID=3002531 RepID=UPI002E7A3CCA|nr:ATP-binding protein [Streptomyces sp. SP18CS02]MEE1757034.1 ATP-binding protein [Streptomyces sp. SP18CS02]